MSEVFDQEAGSDRADATAAVPLPVYSPVCSSGTCDLCGRWDTQLVAGVGACCRGNSVAPPKHPRGWACILPCNEHAVRMLNGAIAAVLMLDEAGAVVRSVEVGQDRPTIHLQQQPPAGVVSGQNELFVGDARTKRKIVRAFFMRCVVEWELPL